MARVDLPGEGQWVELLDPEAITRRHIRKVRLAFAKGENAGEAMEFGREAILTLIVKNWTLEQPLPSAADDPLDVLDSLPRAVWYVLEQIVDDYLPNFGDPAKVAALNGNGDKSDPPKPLSD